MKFKLDTCKMFIHYVLDFVEIYVKMINKQFISCDNVQENTLLKTCYANCYYELWTSMHISLDLIVNFSASFYKVIIWCYNLNIKHKMSNKMWNKVLIIMYTLAALCHATSAICFPVSAFNTLSQQSQQPCNSQPSSIPPHSVSWLLIVCTCFLFCS